jgi:ABC-2 type transport system ATP-binding protein
MKRVVEFNNIHRGYQRGIDVLDGVSFSIDAGQIVGLLGKNGAGKTTLMRIAMGMIEARQGSVRLFGLDPRNDAVAVKRRVGYVSEDQILPPFFRIGAVLDLHRQLYTETWDESMAGRLLERFSLPLGSKIKDLSKGQARQVALLCAVSHRPELLLLDEPAGGLDPAARREFLETSIHLLNETGSTILFSSHHMSDVERMADRVVLLHQGKVLLDSELDQLREQYCLAMVPGCEEEKRRHLLGLDGCLGVRERPGALHVIMRHEPEQAAALLEAELGIGDIRCTRLGLEEMFIELVGGRS